MRNLYVSVGTIRVADDLLTRFSIHGILGAQRLAVTRIRMAGFSRMMMTLDELTQAMHEFVSGQGWYAPDSRKPQTPKNIACSLAIEAAEVLEHFQWSDELQDGASLSSELADVALYLLQLASVTGIDLEQAILDKLAVNASRTWPAPGQSPQSERAAEPE